MKSRSRTPAASPRCCTAATGSSASLPASAAPLGCGARGAFPETRIALDGGTLYLFSDGLIEAACADSRERLGSEGLMRLILRFAAKPPSARIAAIASDVARVELRDDLSLLAVSDAQQPELMAARPARTPPSPINRESRLILLIRHGETPSNAARVVQTPDTPLSARGRDRRERLAARLAALSVARILASDLARAVQTAEPVQAATRAELELEPLLQERNFGDVRGTPYSELGFDLFGPEFEPPGGESWEAFHRRVDAAWPRVLDVAAAHAAAISPS